MSREGSLPSGGDSRVRAGLAATFRRAGPHPGAVAPSLSRGGGDIFAPPRVLSYDRVQKFLVVACVGSFLLPGCGYRLANKNLNAGQGRTIAVPTFTNSTTTYRIEQRLTEAVRQEFLRRTRFKVVPAPTGDVVL